MSVVNFVLINIFLFFYKQILQYCDKANDVITICFGFLVFTNLNFKLYSEVLCTTQNSYFVNIFVIIHSFLKFVYNYMITLSLHESHGLNINNCVRLIM